jgi:polyhydroxybutyrate depolymerase
MNVISIRCWQLLLLVMVCLSGCTSFPHTGPIKGPVTYNRTMALSTGGFQRSYRVHVPGGYDGRTLLPLVVVVHGAFDTAKGMEEFSGFSRLADRENFIVLYPNGIGILGYLQHWNAGHCCGKAAEDNIDDVGYLAAAIDDVSARLRVDRSRVYMVGFSNGGMLTYRFAAERGDLLAAAAPLAASIGGRPSAAAPQWRIPDPVKPLPLLVMHGRADDDIPLAGGRSEHRKGERTYLSVDASVKFWREHNGCTGPPSESRLAGGAVQVRTWEACRDQATVAVYTIEKWGHVWPGPYFTADLPADDPLRNFDAAEIIWAFFKRFHAKPGTAADN